MNTLAVTSKELAEMLGISGKQPEAQRKAIYRWTTAHGITRIPGCRTWPRRRIETLLESPHQPAKVWQ